MFIIPIGYSKSEEDGGKNNEKEGLHFIQVDVSWYT